MLDKFMRIFYLLTMICSISFAQIPTYYSNIDFSESPEEVKSQLESLVRNTHLYRLNYTPQTWYALKEIDLDPTNQENVLLMYGYNDNDSNSMNDRSRDKDLSCHTSSCTGKWNREHVYPKSTGNYDVDSWPGSDVHSLRPCDTRMNELRWNSPFVDGSGNSHMVSSYRFYPGDEWKGDIARMIMYMYLRYPDNCLPNYVGDDDNTYHTDMPDIFLEWNAEDPVSDFEMNRNNLIQSDYQGNRNPFIDNPYLATMIWGGPQAENTWESLSVEEVVQEKFSVYPNPTTDKVFYSEQNFSQIHIYNSTGKLVGKDLILNDNQTVLPNDKGLYFIEFCTKENCQTVKVLKK